LIAGQAGSTYTLTEADVGPTFSASATYTDGQNFAATVTTATTNAAGEVFVKPTAATATTVTASNSLFNMFGTPAITGAFTYNWDISTDRVTWTSAASGVTFGPAPTGVAGRVHPHDGALRGQRWSDAACAVRRRTTSTTPRLASATR
jgi:hypothetical protein